MSSSRKKLTKNIFSLGIIQVANYAFPMISIPIISRVIGPDKLGVINFISSFVAYFTLLIGFGFDLTATRKVAVDPMNIRKRNKIFSEVFFSQCLLLLISAIIFSAALFFSPQLQQEKLVAIFTFTICFSTVLTQNWLFQAMQDLSKVAILNLVSKVLFTITVLLLVKNRGDYIWQPLALSIAQIGVGIISFAWAVKKYKLRLYWVKLTDCISLLWQEKIFFISICIVNLYTNTNIITLGLLQNSTQVGYYTAAQKLISILQSIISMPMVYALYPFIGKAFGESKEKGLAIVQKLTPIVFIFTFFAGIVIWIGSPFFIGLFYGEQFQQSVLICRVLAFIPMIIAVGTIIGIHVMLNLNLDKLFLKVTIIGAIYSVIMNFLLVKKFGYLGSAFTWVSTEFINLCLLFWVLKKIDINIINLDYFKPATILRSVKSWILNK